MLCRLNFEFSAALWQIRRARPVVNFRGYWVEKNNQKGQLALAVLREFSQMSLLEVEAMFLALYESVQGVAPAETPPSGQEQEQGGAPDQEQGGAPDHALPSKTRWGRRGSNKVIATV